MIRLTGPTLGLKTIVVLCLFGVVPERALAHSYQACFARRVQICEDFFPPSMKPECVISAIGSCASHSHEGGGFTPVEFPFGVRTFPGFEEMLEDDSVSAETRAMAREALEAYRVYEESLARQFNAMLRAETLTDGHSPDYGPGAEKE